MEAAFRKMDGVLSTAVGYEGGKTENPTYKDVCTDRTGHAEVVEVDYDPAKVGFDSLLDVFWENHNPTTLNYQGPDYGSQYRSAIFYHDEAQRETAESSRQRWQPKFKKPIVTEIVPAQTFFRAEEYHQQYLEKRGLAQCHI